MNIYSNITHKVAYKNECRYGHWKSTLAMAYRQNNDQNYDTNDTQNNQFHLHILEPHIPFHLGSLYPKILCLNENREMINKRTNKQSTEHGSRLSVMCLLRLTSDRRFSDLSTSNSIFSPRSRTCST